MDGEFELLDPRFTDPVAAAEYLEGLRWPNGVVCPHCGESEREPYRLKSKATKRRLWEGRRGWPPPQERKANQGGGWGGPAPAVSNSRWGWGRFWRPATFR